MSKKNRERRSGDEPAAPAKGDAGTPGGGPGWIPIGLSLVALAFSFALWTDAKKTGERLKGVEDKVDSISSQIAAAQAEALKRQQRQQGPDPNRAYSIKLDGAPTHGNPAAMIAIAEFSDYQ